MYRGFQIVRLYKDGTLELVRDNDEIETQEWYKDDKTGKYWFSVSDRNFKSLVKQIIKEDY